jgi:hypothetical protein
MTAELKVRWLLKDYLFMKAIMIACVIIFGFYF